MGSSAKAIIMYGFPLDTDAVDEDGLSEDWRERRYGVLWAAMGLDATALENPDAGAGYGSESEHFIQQVAQALGLDAQPVWGWSSNEYVIGVPLVRAGKAQRVDLSAVEASISSEAVLRLARVAEVFGVDDVGVHLVPFYG